MGDNSFYEDPERIPKRKRSGKNLLNKSVFKKTSGLLAAVMIVSMLVPILAFAAGFVGFKNVNYDHNGTVTGQVYFDSRVTDSVYLNVYSNGSFTNSVGTATYATYANGHYFYDFSFTVSNATYNPIDLHALVDGSQWGVYNAVYKQSAPPTGCTINCGGGGGVVIPPVTDNTVEDTNGTINSDTLKAALAQHDNVILNISGDTVEIPASALIDAALRDGVTITIVGEHGTYILPLSVLMLEDLAKELSVEVKDLKINVGITKVTGEQATAVTEAVQNLGATLVADVIDFTLTAEGVDGKEIAIESFGDTYVSRQLTLTSTATKPTTGVVFDPVNGVFSFVPSTFSTDENKTIATIKRNSNSIYTVIELEKSFNDINAHWAQSNIELLGSKLIVDGVTDLLFEPDRNITRAEFAALLVRSLGLQLDTGASTFNDVSAGEWFSGVVGAAAKAGLIDGYEDGTFRPDRQITREELAAMAVRALKYAGMEIHVDAAKQATILAAWSDSNEIIWGHNEIAAAIEAGIVDGMTDTTLEVRDNATRAQSATMLKRFLTKANFID